MSSLFFFSEFDFLYTSLAEVYAIVNTPAENTPTNAFEIPAMYSTDDDGVIVVMENPATPADIARPHTNRSLLIFFVLSYIFPKTGADTTPDIKPKPAIKPAVDGFTFK